MAADTKPLLPIALLLLAAALGVLWLGFGGADEPAPVRPGPPPAAAEEPTTPGPAPAQASTTSEDTAASDLELPDLSNLRDEVPIDASEASAAPRVLVVDGDPAQPVAGAEVLFVTVGEAMERRGDDLPARRLEWPEFCGDRSETGTDGIAILRPTRRTFLVAARHGDRFGFGVARPGNRTATVTLRADETVTILVRDTEERFVPGIPVALLQHRGDSRKRGGDTIWRGESGPDGRAVAPHFQYLRERRRNGQKERFAAAVQAATPAPVLVEFDGRPAPPDPIELVVPPLGAVELLLADHQGEPLLSPARVSFTPVQPQEHRSGYPSAGHMAAERRAKPVGPDPVRFDHLGLGTELRPVARFESERRAAIGEPITVPPATADTTAPLQVTMKLPERFGLLAGRLVLADGSPIADRAVVAVLWDGDKNAGSVRLHTTATGHFDAVQSPRTQSALALEFNLSVPTAPQPTDGGPTDGGPAASGRAPQTRVGARVDFQPPAGKVRRELGEIVLGELPVLCSGVVVDDRGQPIPRATVVAQFKRPSPPGNRSRPRTPFQLNQLPVQLREQQFQLERFRMLQQRAERWRNVPFLRTRTAADGTFELRGRFPTGSELRLEADSDQHLADTVAWNGPGQTFRIRIDRNGFLRGRALLPRGLPNECATLTLKPIESQLQGTRTRRVQLSRRRGGRFEVEPLHAGRYDAIVTLRSIKQPVLTVKDVYVTPGEVRDPRLTTIDLRQSVFRYRLRAVDPRGNRLRIDSPLMLRWRDPDGRVQNSGLRWQRGRADFYASSSVVDLVSFAPGCKPLETQLSPGEHAVTMERVVPAQVLVPGARQLCGPDRKIRVSVILSGDSGYPQSLSGLDQRTGNRFSFPRWDLGKSTGAWLEASDLVQVPVVQSGKYRIVLRVHATQSTKSRQVSVELGEYELKADGTQTSPVTVALDLDKLQQALARLPQQKK